MGEGIPPICQAMVLCEGLYLSPSTLRMSLLETIGNRLLANDFPQPWSSIAVYLVLTSGHGSTVLVLRWLGPDGEPLPGSEQQLEVDFTDALEMREVFFSCEELVFPEPGEYRVELITAGNVLAERRLFVFPPSS
jgi:hypothetical protein